MTHTAQSKVQLTNYPMLPGTCVMCNRSGNGVIRFLDFQKDLEYYGVVVICEDCGKEMLEALDYSPVAERDSLVLELEAKETELNIVREENERLRNALDSILVVRPDVLLESRMDVSDVEDIVVGRKKKN